MGRKLIHLDRKAYLKEYHRNYKRSYIPLSQRGADSHGSSLVRFAVIRTHEEVASILGISANIVRLIERKALYKLSKNPVLQQYWKELTRAH